ncbi:MAG: TolC family protein [Planctomycetes bacterium]|nr:TolC family protein [Planctomycetota bacterium]
MPEHPTHAPGGSRSMTGTVAGLAAGAVILALMSCSIPQTREAQPAADIPKAFPETAAGTSGAPSSGLTSVDDFFRDPVLTCLIAEALRNNLELKILAERIEIESSKVLARSGKYMPSVDLNVGATLSTPSKYTTEGAVEEQLVLAPDVPFADPLPGFLVATDFAWELDIWGRLHAAEDAARLHLLATTEGRNYVITRLVAEVAESYYTLLGLDARLEVIDQMITLQQHSLDIARKKKQASRGTELAVQRFEAEVKRNESERLLVQQKVVEAENRINTLVGRYPQAIERDSHRFLELDNEALNLGIPSDLLHNRPDIRRAELEIQSAGMELTVARTAFYPRLTLTGGVGYEANSASYMFQTPETIAANVAGGLVAPLINTAELQAEYLAANAVQLTAIYEYQRTVIEAFTEVVTRLSMVQKYRRSMQLKTEQMKSLEASVASASQLFQNARVEYSEVLFTQRDLLEAKLLVIETKREQLAAIVNTYQALGGGNVLTAPVPDPKPAAPVP